MAPVRAAGAGLVAALAQQLLIQSSEQVVHLGRQTNLGISFKRRSVFPRTMQLYNVTWQFPEIEGQKSAYAKLIDYMASGAEADCFDGFELISRTHCPQTGSGVVICKARGTKELFKHFAPWRAMFGVEFDMQPAFSDEEVCACHKELFESMEG